MESIVNYSKFLIDESQREVAVEFKKESKSKYPVGKCPVCGAPVLETSKGWSCTKWKDKGCKFTIWKEDKSLAHFGKKPTASMVKSLLKNGRTSVKGLVSPKTNQKFDRDVILVQENGYWNIKVDFDSSAAKGPGESKPQETEISSTPTDMPCPACKLGHLVHTSSNKFQGWGCDRWREGCRFTIPDEKCGIKLDKYVNQLASNGRTDIIQGFKSQKGNSFSAKLIVKNGKLEMEFENNK